MKDLNKTDSLFGDFLFELGAEELPSGQIKNIADYFSSKLTEILQLAEIPFANCKSFFTPRRICIHIEEIQLNIPDKEIEIKGPPEKIAKTEDGNLSNAGLGFLKKNKAQEQDCFFQDGYIYIKEKIKATNLKSLLEHELAHLLKNTPGIRFMRWANSEAKFARPPQWICAILANEVIDFKFENLQSANKSFGHRFLAPEEFTVTDFEQYKAQLKKQFVTLDQEDRKQEIITEAKKIADSENAQIIFDDDLLDEISLITENPYPILCDFDSRFLEIPDCVLTTVMIKHQRYLPLEQNSKLIEKFIAISNNPLEKARTNIKIGNEKVIVPRFKDAEFFVSEDNKISLEDRLAKLEKLNFLKGNFLQKSHRLEKITNYIAQELQNTIKANPNIDSEIDLKALQQASLLAKTDLTTNLVFEFTELQGLIGGIYASKQGLNDQVAQFIAEHYKPCFAADSTPSSLGAKIISIADKIDNIVCSFALGKIPSGSADPFALRRQANGLLEIITESQLIIDIEALIDYVCQLQQQEFGTGEQIKKIKGRGDKRQEIVVDELSWDNTNEQVANFLETRLEFVFEQINANKNINKSVLSASNSLKELHKRHMNINFLSSISKKKEFDNLVEGVNRIINICKGKEFPLDIDPQLFESNFEKEFYEISQKLEACKNQNLSYEFVYSENLLFSAAGTINQFFDNVLVNSEQDEVRNNRQALVAYANKTFKNLADFSLIKA